MNYLDKLRKWHVQLLPSCCDHPPSSTWSTHRDATWHVATHSVCNGMTHNWILSPIISISPTSKLIMRPFPVRWPLHATYHIWLMSMPLHATTCQYIHSFARFHLAVHHSFLKTWASILGNLLQQSFLIWLQTKTLLATHPVNLVLNICAVVQDLVLRHHKRIQKIEPLRRECMWDNVTKYDEVGLMNQHQFFFGIYRLFIDDTSTIQ